MSSEQSALYATDRLTTGLLDTGKGEYNGNQVISRSIGCVCVCVCVCVCWGGLLTKHHI